MQTELPDWLEKWILEHEYLSAGAGDYILTEDLRALLADKVLCEKEPVRFHCGNCNELGLLYKAADIGGSNDN